MYFSDFRNVVNQYCDTFGFERPSKLQCRNLWNIYKKDINANCYDDISLDVAKFLDNNQNMLKDKMIITGSSISFSGITSATTTLDIPCVVSCAKDCRPFTHQYYQKEEENSMTEKTEAAVQRDYLNARLKDVCWKKESVITDLFNMHKDPTPRNYKELIDAIKNDKFTLDKDRVKKIDKMIEADQTYGIFGCFDGIKFDGGPDIDGFNAADAELRKRFQAAKDVIMGGVYADGLKAVQDFEAWTPEGKAS